MNALSLVSPCPDLLVPPRGSGAQVQEANLLQAGLHRAAVPVCQPLLPRGHVGVALKWDPWTPQMGGHAHAAIRGSKQWMGEG